MKHFITLVVIVAISALEILGEPKAFFNVKPWKYSRIFRPVQFCYTAELCDENLFEDAEQAEADSPDDLGGKDEKAKEEVQQEAEECPSATIVMGAEGASLKLNDKVWKMKTLSISDCNEMQN
ncbi:uncharacterized protein LOC132255606 [Phlebotomus argentipes]|uniref:uncharacterized protein LOC132255606 n=1 Tax=Phlebotomus argentipes TaxID=94469 RepID=UPI00289302C9|nr:uncharacterized protein LOC132255606 [Phlebotomus argentipes]